MKTIADFKGALDTLGCKLEASDVERIWENLRCDEQEYTDLLAWIREKQQSCVAGVERVGLKSTLGEEWYQDQESGDIVHKSGGFFKIIGVKVSTDQRESGKGWKQPMVDQGTESSIAGFLRQEHNGIPRYLVEAKFEPGNYGKVLISPSLQVTYSNLYQAHGGARPRFADYFDGSEEDARCLYSQWMPEDGGRFYLKRVKYMIVQLPPQVVLSISENYRWISVSTLKRMLYMDNYINPHVRSLLAVM